MCLTPCPPPGVRNLFTGILQFIESLLPAHVSKDIFSSFLCPVYLLWIFCWKAGFHSFPLIWKSSSTQYVDIVVLWAQWLLFFSVSRPNGHWQQMTTANHCQQRGNPIRRVLTFTNHNKINGTSSEAMLWCSPMAMYLLNPNPHCCFVFRPLN